MHQTNNRFPPIETLPVCSTICNPFRFFDLANCPNGTGYVQTPEDWPARRAERMRRAEVTPTPGMRRSVS